MSKNNNLTPTMKGINKITKRKLLVSVATILTIYIAYVLFLSFSQLKITTALVNAPVVQIAATSSGQLDFINNNPGGVIKKGQSLADINDIHLKHQLESLKIKAKNTELTTEKLQAQLNAHRVKLDMYRQTAQKQLTGAQAQTEKLQNQFQQAQIKLKKYLELQQQGHMSIANIEQATANLKDIRHDLQIAENQQDILQGTLNMIDKGIYYNGNTIVSGTAELQASIRRSIKQEKLDKLSMASYEQLVKQLNIKAPFKGKILKVFKINGDLVKHNEPLMLVENDVNKTIKAYLTQEESLQIKVGSKATIFIPGKNIKFKAIVNKVDVTNNYINENNQQYQWNLAYKRPVSVTLSIENISDLQKYEKLPAGVPVIVNFHRNIARFLLDKIIPS